MTAKFLLPALAALLPVASHGQATAKWIAGSGDHPWADALNWDQEAFPGGADSEADTIKTTLDLSAEIWENLTTEAANGTHTATGILASNSKRFFRLRTTP